MARNVPTISLTEREVTDFWGQQAVQYGWEIRRANVVTESGDGYASARDALDFAIGVAEGRYA